MMMMMLLLLKGPFPKQVFYAYILSEEVDVLDLPKPTYNTLHRSPYF